MGLDGPCAGAARARELDLKREREHYNQQSSDSAAYDKGEGRTPEMASTTEDLPADWLPRATTTGMSMSASMLIAQHAEVSEARMDAAGQGSVRAPTLRRAGRS